MRISQAWTATPQPSGDNNPSHWEDLWPHCRAASPEFPALPLPDTHPQHPSVLSSASQGFTPPATHLKVFLVQNLLPPLDQEGGTHIEMEVREPFWLRLQKKRRVRQGSEPSRRTVGLALLRHLEGGKPILVLAMWQSKCEPTELKRFLKTAAERVESGQRDFQPSHSAGGWPTRGSRRARAPSIPGTCPTGGWCSGEGAPASAGCSSTGRQTAGTPPRTA